MSSGDKIPSPGDRREPLLQDLLDQAAGRPRHWKAIAKRQEDLQKVKQLLEVNPDISDQKLADLTKLSIHRVSKLRLELGIKRPKGRKRRHTEQSSIKMAQVWFAEEHFSPAVADWYIANANQAGHQDRIDRLAEFTKRHGKVPTYTAILYWHKSWPAFIKKAGLPPVPKGRAASAARKSRSS